MPRKKKEVDHNARKNHQAAVPVADMEPYSCDASLGAEKTQGLDTPCRISVHSRRHRLADADGISAKAAIDGVVLCGLLPDDSAEYVKEVSYGQEKIPKTEIEETIITLAWR